MRNHITKPALLSGQSELTVELGGTVTMKREGLKMQIVKLDVRDGKGEIEVAVTDATAARRLEDFFQWAIDVGNERDEASDLLHDIGSFAHDQSTGPAVPDALWEVRRMAYRE